MFRESEEARAARIFAAEHAKIEFPAELPISRHVTEITQLWSQHQLIIVGGATGSGKTTQLPKIALQLQRGRAGRIGCTQPRRIAALSMARRLALETNSEFGRGVGCQMRFDDHTAPDTFLKFMTDGILLAETRHDRQLRQYDALIIDEAHERSLNIDFLLGYLKNLLPRRPDLKVAISSATLDVARFSEFFNDAPVVAIEGRSFPVEDYFMPPEDDEPLDEHIARAVDFLSSLDRRGDILVFLPGEREIREATDLLTGRNLPQTEVLPLFARLSGAEQQKVFHPGSRRRIILATNVAETSLTIPGIKYCIDSGLARIKRFNPRSQIEELQVEMISQSSARQRRGRCGRTADGICVHLYSEDDLERALPYTDPELRRSSLAGVILQMAALKLPRIDHFPFIDPPSAALIREGLRTLYDLKALDQAGGLTERGRRLAQLPVDPHLGAMLLEGEARKLLPEMAVAVSFLSIRDPRERPEEKKQAADDFHRSFNDDKSDFIAILNLWRYLYREQAFETNGTLRRCCRKAFLNFNRVREWRNLAADLASIFPHGKVENLAEETPYEPFHEAIAAGIPRHIGCYDSEYHIYHGTDGKKFYLFPGSGLAKLKKSPPWILSFAIVETARVFARCNAAIKPEIIEKVAPHLCSKVCDQAAFEVESGFVRARERVTFGGLLIHPGRRVDYGRLHPQEAREIFIRDGILPGLVDLPHTPIEEFNRRREELRRLEIKVRRLDSIYDEEMAAEWFLETLPPEVNSVRALKLACRAGKIKAPDSELITQEQFIKWDKKDYPDQLKFEGATFPVRYVFEPGDETDGATLQVPQKALNLLPGWALDAPISGWLPDLIELFLHALPRDLRRQFSLPEATAEFVRRRRNGEILQEEPLHLALADFLSREYEVTVRSDLFLAVRRPEYLQLKVAVLDDRQRQIEVLHQLPEHLAGGSRISGALPGAGKFIRAAVGHWPSLTPMPGEVMLGGASGKVAYPALSVEKNGVAQQLFLKLNEAKFRHRAGVLELFRLANAPQVKFIRKFLKFSAPMKLSWLVQADARAAEDDLVSCTIEEAFPLDLWLVRSGEAFDQASETAREELGNAADAVMKNLQELYAAYREVDDLLPKLHKRAPDDAVVVEEHLELLFAPGFLRRPAVWSDYKRYLRALARRTERLIDSPLRDRAKEEPLSPYLDRLYEVWPQDNDLTLHPEVYDFWVLVEEGRIAQFAPEIALKIRTPLRKLDEFRW